MSLGKRFWDVVRSNATDFSRSLFGEGDGLGASERAEVEAELKDTLGSRAGKKARKVKDAAEEAWERAYRAAQARGEAGGGPMATEDQVADWYRTLEVDEGADFREVRRAYRKLLAKYHPDRYASDPEKYQAATAVARRITVAYNGLKAHIGT